MTEALGSETESEDVCQSVRDKTEAEALMGLETTSRLRRRDRDYIPPSLTGWPLCLVPTTSLKPFSLVMLFR